MATDDPVLALTRALIGRPSVTPRDEGCQALLRQRLEAAGFHCRDMPFGDVPGDGVADVVGEVSNLWAVHGSGGPLMVFAGHTDVVPTGPEGAWASPPFEPTVRGGMLYGRGAADMKGSLAAMVVAAERFVAAHPDHPGRLAFLITSDEEGPAVHGTRAVVDALTAEGVVLDYCLVGEPSSTSALADTVRIGRRGSLNGELTVRGVQGHVAYPDLADNPIHRLAPVLAELAATRWDEGNEQFPPTTWQVSNIAAGTGATNVVPGELTMSFNFRFSTEQTAEALEERFEAILERHGLNYHLRWSLSGEPFLTARGELVDAVVRGIREETGREPALSTSGGTSDGRFIAPTGCQVVELGPVNATIHQVDECVTLAELPALARIYERVLQSLLGPRTAA